MNDLVQKLSLDLLSKSSPSTFQSKSLSTRLQKPPPLPANASKSSNLSHVPCKFFKQGTCTAGANCIFSHNPDPTSESSVCKYFRKGNCKFGSKCALLHTMSPYSVRPNSTAATSGSSALNPLSTSWSANDYFADPFGSSAPSFLLAGESFQRTSYSYQSSQREIIPEQQDYFDDANDFMLPSSLNDLLTPTELRNKQQMTTNLSRSHHNSRQPSYESSSSSWNVSLYNGTATNFGYDDSIDHQRYFTSNAINIPGGSQHNMRAIYSQQGFLPSSTNQLDEDGPFIMEDATFHSCTETEQEPKLFIYNT